jgi:hypothetical protein
MTTEGKPKSSFVFASQQTAVSSLTNGSNNKNSTNADSACINVASDDDDNDEMTADLEVIYLEEK